MRKPYQRLAAIARTAAVALGIATPARAQFGGLKKKLKAAAAPEAATPATPAEGSDAPAPAERDGDMIVLTGDVLDRLLAGLKAGEAERQRAAQEDTPYGKYQRAQAAYEAAQPKCQQAQQTFPQRMAADEKLMNRYQKLVDRMVEAQGKGDSRTAAVYTDSAMAMQDPPGRHAAGRRVGLGEERPLGACRRAKAAPRHPRPRAAARAQACAAARRGTARAGGHRGTAVPPGSAALNACMTQNVQKHEPAMRALGERAEAAQKAGNTTAMMAIADTLQRLQMAGCTRGR